MVIFSAISSRLNSSWLEPGTLPFIILARLTSPLDQPFSNSDIGLILIIEKRPAPEWSLALSSGLAEPVRINWPLFFLMSTSRLI
jgi:hypothetical protein